MKLLIFAYFMASLGALSALIHAADDFWYYMALNIPGIIATALAEWRWEYIKAEEAKWDKFEQACKADLK